MKKKRIIFGSVALVAVVLIVAVVLGISLYKNKGVIKPEMAKLKAENYINTYLMQSGSKATISEVTEAYGLYKVKVNIGSDQKVDSYISRDGALFFPQALNMDEASKTAATNSAGSNAAASAPVDVPKNDKPKVELFVMSYCPYGTQIEKGILPALKALGNKIDYELKFVDYSMHGDKELKENLVQYCIQKEQRSKFNDYLTCFLKASDSASCLTSAGVDVNKNNACVAKTDAEFSVTANAKNNIGYQGTFPGFDTNKADNTKYSVAGSPTLIINGKDVSSGRDSASLLKAICSAFTTQPKECETTLSSASPAPGFGEGTAASGSAAAGCGQ
ncbi:MAG: hypothetical protein WCK59_00480 [Candidatus Falkowbacteria bacterium]